MPTGRTLLLADDSPTVQKVVSLTFDDEGFKVIAVGGGAEALEQLERGVPDVVLADVHMPAPGGYELCARIKRDGRTRHVPVMLLVGAFEPFDEAEARRVGADEVLTKPFQSIRELVNKVGGMLGGQPDPVKTDERDPASAARADDSAPRGFDSLASERDAEASGSRAFESSSNEGANARAAAPAFADFGVDDEGIEAATPDEFAARTHQHAAEFAESRPAAVNAAPQGVAAAASAAAPRAQTFESRAEAAAAADDALLELGDFDSPGARDTGSDDFVLDMGDADAFTPPRAAAVEPAATQPYAATAYAEDAPPAVEMMGAGSLSMAEPSAAWEAAEEFAVSPEAITEPVQPPAQAAEPAATHYDDDTAAQAFEARGAATFDESATPGATATREVAGVESSGQTQAGAAELSPEAIDAIARRVVEHLSERVVREIAWEVVPDLAERLIRRKLEEEGTRAK